MNRRELMLAAPAVALGAIVPTQGQAEGAAQHEVCPVLQSETPVGRAFLGWSNLRDQINSPALSGVSEAGFNLIVSRLDADAAELLAIPCQTPRDFILKVIAVTDWGGVALPDETRAPELWAEARALVNWAHRII